MAAPRRPSNVEKYAKLPSCPVSAVSVTGIEKGERQLRVYSVEKHKIDGDLIFLPRALSTLDPHPACPSADARAPTDVSSVSQYPLVSRCLGRL